MANEKETVVEIVKRVRQDCNSYPLPTAAAEMLKLVREIDAAHQREVAELRECLKVAEDALESGIFNLDAWVNGGRFVHTESDDDSLSKMRNAFAAIKREGGAK